MTRLLMVLALALGIGFATSAPSHAQASLEAAKQSGLIGERPDGLVGFVAGTVSTDVRAMVDQINAQRMRRYNQVAQTNGTPVDNVQALAGRQLMERTPAGQYVLSASGQWIRKQHPGKTKKPCACLVVLSGRIVLIFRSRHPPFG